MMVVLILVAGCFLYWHGEACQTRALFDAVSKNDIKKAELRLDSGANVNGKRYTDEETPLIAAVIKGQTEMVDLLLKYGADVNAADNGGRRAIHHVMMAYGIGARSNLPTERVNILTLLIKEDADIDVKDARGIPPLIYAVSWSGDNRELRIECVKLLIKAGVDVNAKSNMGETALMLARRGGDQGMVALLLAAGA